MFVTNGHSPSFDLAVKRSDGSGPAQILLDVDRGLLEGRCSPDGQWLVVRMDDQRDILAMRPGVDSGNGRGLYGERDRAKVVGWAVGER